MSKLLDWNEAGNMAARIREDRKRLVFTNGCFDIIHAGHAGYLEDAKKQGEYLFVGMNSDGSVKRIKGEGRPIFNEKDRAEALGGLRSVDAVILFDQDDPLELIEKIKPDVLVKGGDWDIKDVVGREAVEGRGGKVMTIPVIGSSSTTSIIEKAGRLG